MNKRVRGLAEALLVTVLWSSSYVLTKIGLKEVTPLLLVSLRYTVASVILLTLALTRGEHRRLDAVTLRRMLVLGVTGYTVAQGLQCVGLFYLPAVTVTFILNFTPVFVLLLNLVLLAKYPNRTQLAGTGLILAGSFLFFGGSVGAGSLTGIAVTVASGVGWGLYLILGARWLRDSALSPLGVTAFTMGLGTGFIVLTALLIEGYQPVPASGWVVILWLGVVNTAAAFFLWNDALRKVEAFEVAVLQNTMLIQIALLSVVFLGEQLTPRKIAGMLLVFTGVLVAQARTKKSVGEETTLPYDAPD